jgi:DNA-binding NarL/FixJ family response regulator
MNARRVFVIWMNPIFREAVRLLLKHPEIEHVGASAAYEVAHEEILEARPDTILVEAAVGPVPKEAMDIFEADDFRGRLIICSLDDNRLNIFQHEQSTVVHAEDFLRLILQ